MWRCCRFLRFGQACDRCDTLSGLAREHPAKAGPSRKKLRNPLGGRHLRHLALLLAPYSLLSGILLPRRLARKPAAPQQTLLHSLSPFPLGILGLIHIQGLGGKGEFDAGGVEASFDLELELAHQIIIFGRSGISGPKNDLQIQGVRIETFEIDLM